MESKQAISKEEAKVLLRNYSDNAVQYVKECQYDVMHCLAYHIEHKVEVPKGKIEDIVHHYVIEAEDEGIMSAKDFEDILDLLDAAGSFGQSTW